MKKPLHIHVLSIFFSGILALPTMAGPKEEAALKNRIEALEEVTAAQKKQIADLQKERDALKRTIAEHEAAMPIPIMPANTTVAGAQPAQKTAQEEKARKAEEEYEHNGLALMLKTVVAKKNEITGTIENRSGQKLKFVEVSFNLYDEDGARVGTASAVIEGFEAGGTWKFNAIVLERKWSKYKLNELKIW